MKTEVEDETASCFSCFFFWFFSHLYFDLLPPLYFVADSGEVKETPTSLRWPESLSC